jgi:hypothetical protein
VINAKIFFPAADVIRCRPRMTAKVFDETCVLFCTERFNDSTNLAQICGSHVVPSRPFPECLKSLVRFALEIRFDTFDVKKIVLSNGFNLMSNLSDVFLCGEVLALLSEVRR